MAMALAVVTLLCSHLIGWCDAGPGLGLSPTSHHILLSRVPHASTRRHLESESLALSRAVFTQLESASGSFALKVTRSSVELIFLN